MVNRSALLFSSCFLVAAVACSEPADPGELCELADDGTGGAFDEVVGPEVTGLEVRQLGHHSGIGVQDPEFDAPVPPGLADMAGIDPRVPVTSSRELQSYPWRTIVQVEQAIPGEFGATLVQGSGFLVGPRHVLTNHHVATDENDNKDEINPLIEMAPPGFYFHVYPGRAANMSLNGGAWDVERVVFGPNAWNGFYWSGEDYALLILEDDPDRSGVLGWMGMCSPTDSTIEGLPINSTGYPGYFNKCANSPDPGPECDCGGWMYTQECSVTDHNLYTEEFGHTCKSMTGQSGSPMWVAECTSSSAACAVGVLWGKLGSEPRAKRLDSATVDYLRQAICASGSEFVPSPWFCN